MIIREMLFNCHQSKASMKVKVVMSVAVVRFQPSLDLEQTRRRRRRFSAAEASLMPADLSLTRNEKFQILSKSRIAGGWLVLHLQPPPAQGLQEYYSGKFNSYKKNM